jgi:hypothetical protein
MGIKNILKIAKKILTKKKDEVEEPMILKTEDVIKKPEVNQDRITETTSTLTRETQLTWVEYLQNQNFFSKQKCTTRSCNTLCTKHCIRRKPSYSSCCWIITHYRRSFSKFCNRCRWIFNKC